MDQVDLVAMRTIARNRLVVVAGDVALQFVVVDAVSDEQPVGVVVRRVVVASLTSVVSVALTPTAPVPSKGLLMLLDPARTTAAATPTRITPVIAAMAIPATQLL